MKKPLTLFFATGILPFLYIFQHRKFISLFLLLLISSISTWLPLQAGEKSQLATSAQDTSFTHSLSEKLVNACYTEQLETVNSLLTTKRYKAFLTPSLLKSALEKASKAEQIPVLDLLASWCHRTSALLKKQ